MTQLTVHRVRADLRAQLHRFRDLVSLFPLLSKPHPWQARVLHPAPAATIMLPTADGLQLTGSYYRCEGGSTPQPAIVLIHGSSRYGRHQAVIVVLAALLRARGYHVLTYDSRCYGVSPHPARADDAQGFNFSYDVSAALNWLGDRPEVDPTRRYVLGHSFGAGAALTADACDPRIARLVLFGPPRRLAERLLNDDAPDRQRIFARMQRDMNVPYPLDPDVMHQMWREQDIAAHVARFQQPEHTPLLLVDAQCEHDADRAFLFSLWTRMSHRVRYWTAPETDHYLNTGRLLGRVVYHPSCVLPFVDVVDDFLQCG